MMNRTMSKGRILKAALFVALGPAMFGVSAPVAVAETAVSTEMPSFTVSNGKGAMKYYLYVPPTAKPGAPLVVHLHGGNEDARDQARLAGLNELALARGFAVAYPQEDVNNGRQGIWDWSAAAQAGRDGRASSLVAAVTRDAIRRADSDTRRIFTTGASAGGAMTVVMAAQYPDIFSAFLSEAGGMYDGATGPLSYPTGSLTPEDSGTKAYLAMADNARRMPFIVSAGDQDVLAAYTNQEALTRQWLVTNDWVDDRAANLSVGRTPAKSWTGQTQDTTYSVDVYSDAQGCTLGKRYEIHGMGHAYAGGESDDLLAPSMGPNMREVAYDFFLAQTARNGLTNPDGERC